MIVRAELPFDAEPSASASASGQITPAPFRITNRSVAQRLRVTPHMVKAHLQQRARQASDQFARRAEQADGQHRPPHHLHSGDLATTPIGLKDCPTGNGDTHARAAMLEQMTRKAEIMLSAAYGVMAMPPVGVRRRQVMSAQNVQDVPEPFENNKPQRTGTPASPRPRRAS
jgi:hypothetical protein